MLRIGILRARILLDVSASEKRPAALVRPSICSERLRARPQVFTKGVCQRWGEGYPSEGADRFTAIGGPLVKKKEGPVVYALIAGCPRSGHLSQSSHGMCEVQGPVL